jgi:hypothetical protein
LDTREKIISADRAAALARDGATVVSGFFDPMVASTAARLSELKQHGKPLLVAITTAPDSILPARARAELIAGLRVVDYVVESDAGLTPATKLEREDTARLADLIRHVHARQAAS